MQEYMLLRILVIATFLIFTALISVMVRGVHKTWVRFAHKGGK